MMFDDTLISIHAPTRGATISNGLCDGFYAIFQSTLPREERLVAKDFTEGMVVFQSTLPREERLTARNMHQSFTISIHAPTRGATNPLSVLCSLAIIFQSTLPREERHFPYSCQYSIYNFNPRSHERSDQGTKLFKTLLYNFNPRSHERSDGHTSISSSCGNYFNPRSHERSDNPLSVLCSLAIIFQSTLPREERREMVKISPTMINFNPRSHERSD